MKKTFLRLVIIVMATMGIAFAEEPEQISGKDFKDFDIDVTANEDLTGVSLNDMGIDSAFAEDNKEDGKPVNQTKNNITVGSSVGYNRTEQYLNQRFFTPKEFATIMNNSTKLEFT